MVGFIHWNPDPIMIDLGFIAPRWYGLCFALAFLAAFKVMQQLFKTEKLSLEALDSLTVYVMLGTVIGARLGHCLFYEPSYYLANPIEIIKVWEGGLASHGAVIGILVALALFARKNHSTFTFLSITDKIVVAVPLSAAFIRIGNLMNSEIVGKTTDLPWGFIFEKLKFDSAFSPEQALLPRHPTQLYEAIGYLLLFLIMYKNYPKWQAKPGTSFGWMLILLFSIRFLVEFLKEKQVDFEQNLPLDMGQLLSLPLILAGIWLVSRKTKNN